jgi:hypothetical protein
MSLKYAKNAVVKGFVGVPDQLAIYGQNNTFADASTATAQQRIDEIFTLSNNCRDGSTIFSDEKPFLPVSQSYITAQAALYNSPSGTEGAPTEPPIKKEENKLATALLIGAGVFVLYKILS